MTPANTIGNYKSHSLHTQSKEGHFMMSCPLSGCNGHTTAEVSLKPLHKLQICGSKKAYYYKCTLQAQLLHPLPLLSVQDSSSDRQQTQPTLHTNRLQTNCQTIGMQLQARMQVPCNSQLNTTGICILLVLQLSTWQHSTAVLHGGLCKELATVSRNYFFKTFT